MLSVFVALDRSGSMSGPSWTNAIDSLNEYVGGLQNEKIEGDITIIAFDAPPSLDVRLTPIVENQSIAYFETLKPDVLSPAGMTPLYDAAANVMDRALERNNDRTVVVILTDGAENASKEYTQAKIKAKVEQLQAKTWEVIFLGANFDVAEYTKSAGLDMTKMRNFDMNDTWQRTSMTEDLTRSTTAYVATGMAIDLSK